MCFIDSNQRDRNRLQGGVETTAAKAFGRDVNEFVFAAAKCIDSRALLGFRNRAVDEGGGQAASAQCVNLILHQRDQRRDNERDAIADHRRQLITERLAASGRHDDDRVFAFQNGCNHFALAFAKVVKPEVLLQ